MPGQREPAGTPPSSAGQQQPGWPREQRAEQHPAAEQSQQGQPRRAAGGRSWVQVVQGQRAAAGGGAQASMPSLSALPAAFRVSILGLLFAAPNAAHVQTATLPLPPPSPAVASSPRMRSSCAGPWRSPCGSSSSSWCGPPARGSRGREGWLSACAAPQGGPPLCLGQARDAAGCCVRLAAGSRLTPGPLARNPQAAGGAARRVEEEVDLTRGTPAPQRSQPPRAAPAAAAPDGGVLHWRQLLQRVVLAEEDMGQLEVEEEVQPRDAAGGWPLPLVNQQLVWWRQGCMRARRFSAGAWLKACMQACPAQAGTKGGDVIPCNAGARCCRRAVRAAGGRG
jgi:hypothetical protein